MGKENTNIVRKNGKRCGKFLYLYANTKNVTLLLDCFNSFFKCGKNGYIKPENVVKVYGKVVKPTDEDKKNTIVRQVKTIYKNK